MIFLVIGLLIFLGIHSASIFAAERRRGIIAAKGKMAWMFPYTVFSLIGLGLIIWGYGVARETPVIIYDTPLWTRHITLMLMLIASILFVMAPISGKIAKALKHPQLVAVKVWALAHLVSNGDLASIVLFGAFLAWAVIARISLKRRVALGLATNNAGGPVSRDFAAIMVGLLIYVFMVLWAHAFLFGVSPIG